MRSSSTIGFIDNVALLIVRHGYATWTDTLNTTAVPNFARRTRNLLDNSPCAVVGRFGKPCWHGHGYVGITRIGIEIERPLAILRWVLVCRAIGHWAGTEVRSLV